MAVHSNIDPEDPRAIAWRKAQPLAGKQRDLAKLFGVSGPAVAQWKICPAERVIEIERLSGISRYELRPDIFGQPEEIDPETAVAQSLRRLVEKIGTPEKPT